MFLGAGQKDRLARVLTGRLRLPSKAAADYVAELTKPASPRLKTLELTIAAALAAQKPPKFGWANVPRAPGATLVQAGTGVIVTGADRRPIWRPQVVPPANFGLLNADEARPHLEQFEGRVRHLYLDAVGNVTVGIGHKVTGLADAQRLPFIFKGKHERAGQAAGPEDIKRDYDAVRAVGSGNVKARFFENVADLRLDDADIDALFSEDFDSHYGDARRHFPMARFPRCVQLGVLDLIFQVGVTRMRDVFVKFQAALKRGDWPRAGEESKITKGVFDSRRNAERARLIAKGVEMAPFFTTDPKKYAPLVDFLLKL